MEVAGLEPAYQKLTLTEDMKPGQSNWRSEQPLHLLAFPVFAKLPKRLSLQAVTHFPRTRKPSWREHTEQTCDRSCCHDMLCHSWWRELGKPTCETVILLAV